MPTLRRIAVLTAVALAVAVSACATAPRVTLTWSIDYTGHQANTAALHGDSAHRLTALVQSILDDPKGWQQDGIIKFRQVADPLGGQVIFRPTELYKTEVVCNKTGAIACGGGTPPFTKPDSCRIYLSQDLLGPDGGHTATATVNHELGHRFLGPDHTATGLMQDGTHSGADNDRYPSRSEVVRAVRNLLPATPSPSRSSAHQAPGRPFF
jgi:hypothetical protein